MILERPYSKELFDEFLTDFLPDFVKEVRQIRTSDKSILTEVTQLGTSKETNLTVLEAECEETDSKKRIAITQAAFRVLRDHGIRNALIAFHDGADQWRLSLLTSTLELIDGKVINKDSSPRRYSYLLGMGAKTRTPHKYLVEKGGVTDIKSLQERFSVEVVNKQFYESVAELFTKLVGGERGRTRYPGLLKITGKVGQNNEHQEFAVRLIGRVIFSWFLKEKKSTAGVPIVPEELLSLSAVESHGDYYHSILEPLFFELLNKRANNRHEALRQAPFVTVPYLNGGLFSPQYDDYYQQNSFTGGGNTDVISIPDSWFTELFTILEQYNFTVDENTSYDVDLSIDPEMLGRIFENLLAEINPDTGESARKSTGSFYTPREVVDFMVDSSLLQFLKSKTGIPGEKLQAIISWGKEDDASHPLTDEEKKSIVDNLAKITILDPACGSGAFPIGLLQKVVYILQQVDETAEIWLENQLKNINSPELRRDIEDKYKNENYDWLRKLGVIRESIYGIDIQAIATEIAKLRCFLTLIIEEEVDDEKENRGIRPLPNLDFKFVTANSLVGLPESSEKLLPQAMNLFEDSSHIDRLKAIRSQYFGADADERARLQIEFKDLQLSMFKSRVESGGATSDLYNILSDWNPFTHDQTYWFDSEWMFGIESFDIVIANPPYGVSIKDGYRDKVTKQLGKVPDFEIYYYFIELANKLLSPGGSLSYIIPNTFLFNVFAAKYRLKLLKEWRIELLLDCTAFKLFESATVHNAILAFSKTSDAKNVGYKMTNQAESFSELVSQNTLQMPIELLTENNTNWGLVFKLSQDVLNLTRKIKSSKNMLIDYFDVSQGYIPYRRSDLVKKFGKEDGNRIVDNREWHSDHKLDSEYKEEIFGKSLTKYGHKGTGSFVKYGRHLASYVEERFFNQKRVLVREITNPVIIASMLDDEYVNDPQIISIIPKHQTDHLYIVWAILNSRLATYYHFNASPKATKGSFPKILVKDIKEFPIPSIEDAKLLINLAKDLLNLDHEHNDSKVTKLEDEIDNKVYELYGITPREIKLIKEATK